MRKMKCGRCDQVNTLGDWNENAYDGPERFKFLLHEIMDDGQFEPIRGNLTFRCPSCQERMTVYKIQEVG